MELNTKCRYAVMAMSDLAFYGANGAALPLSVIAERQDLSLAYLEQLFVKLKRAELVISLRGRDGGYKLSRDARKITIAQIAQAVDEPLEMTRCGVHEPANDGEFTMPGCVRGVRCMTHQLWAGLSDHIMDYLTSTTLADVIAPTVAATKAKPNRKQENRAH